MKNKFEQIEHTADVGIRASGTTLEDLFKNCMAGMLAILTEKKVNDKEKKNIRLSAPDTEALLIDFLNEILFLINTRNWLPADAEIKIKDGVLEAGLKGETVDLWEVLKEEIKAATHHRLAIKKEDDTRWTTEVFFDV